MVLGLAILVTAILLITAGGEADEKKELQEIMFQAANPATKEIPLSGQNVDGFLKAAASLDFDKDKVAVYQSLYLGKSSDGVDIDKKIAKFATTTNLNDQVRRKLFEVLGQRGEKVSVPYLLKFAAETEETEIAEVALNATGENLAKNDFSELLKLISTTGSNRVRSAAERAAKRFLDGQSSNAVAAKELQEAFKNSSIPQIQESFLRLLGATGSTEAERVVEEALSSNETTLKISAYASLANWRDDSFFDKQFKAASLERSKMLRTHAFDSLINFLKGDAKFGAQSKQRMWTKVGSDLRDTRERKTFIRTLATLATKDDGWAIGLVTPLVRDPDDDVSFLAEQALEAMKSRQ